MELSRVIIGQVMTEKAEALKGIKTFTLHIAQDATKVDVKNALKKFYDVEAASVRIMLTRPKTRQMGGRGTMEKRHRMKKALVTLSKKSKTLDLATFKTR
ncbi:MAG: 50S ribosomal protein L23 [Candidatus Peribacteraceae bacterium]|nr:50S ribosomal protein L23 [Candidatus Peribacteraceae bacterium]